MSNYVRRWMLKVNKRGHNRFDSKAFSQLNSLSQRNEHTPSWALWANKIILKCITVTEVCCEVWQKHNMGAICMGILSHDHYNAIFPNISSTFPGLYHAYWPRPLSIRLSPTFPYHHLEKPRGKTPTLVGVFAPSSGGLFVPSLYFSFWTNTQVLTVPNEMKSTWEKILCIGKSLRIPITVRKMQIIALQVWL